MSCVSLWAGVASAKSPAKAEEPSSPKAAPAPKKKPAVDRYAMEFASECAACHTYGRGKIGDAPDLVAVHGWPKSDLLHAIERMQKNVGPLSREEVEGLADFLKSDDVKKRLAAARAVLAARRAVHTEPGNPRIGRELFLGTRPLANGGIGCASCHRAGGRGGSFAVSLAGVFGRRGKSGLISAIENAGFPVMRRAYAAHPVTVQEAVHLTAYFQSIEPKEGSTEPLPAPNPPIGWAGGGLAALFLAGVFALSRRRRPAGTRARLVARAKRKRT